MPLDLQHFNLLPGRNLIGTWCDSRDGRRFDVSDPATDAVITSAPDSGAADARDPVTGWRRLASATLRLGVGRPLAASAAERGLVSAGPSGLCAPGESWAVPSVAPALRRRNTRIA